MEEVDAVEGLSRGKKWLAQSDDRVSGSVMIPVLVTMQLNPGIDDWFRVIRFIASVGFRLASVVSAVGTRI